MSVYDLYQYYLNQLENPVVESPVVQQDDYNPLLYLQKNMGENLRRYDSNVIDRTNNAGITSLSGFADYLLLLVLLH